MAIYLHCVRCKSDQRSSNRVCKKCGAVLTGRDNRRYRVRVRRKGADLSRLCETLEEARKVEAQFKSEMLEAELRGDLGSVSKMGLTLQEFLDKHYAPWLLSHRKNRQSTEKELSALRNHCHTIMSRRLDEISSYDLEQIKVRMLERELAPRTVQWVIRAVHQVFARAIAWGFMRGTNPAGGVDLPRFDNRRERFLSYEEASRLLSECERRTTPYNLLYPLVYLALHTGMRAGELFNLRWKDIDLENGVISIKDPKGGENRRVFVLSDALEVLKDLRDEVEDRIGRELSGEDPVFLKPDGKPFTQVPSAFDTAVKICRLNEGIEDPRDRVTFHTLRHTFCSWLAIQGTPLHVIKELAGHKTIQMTERYAHLLPDVRRKAMEEMWETFLKEGLKNEKEARRRNQSH